MKNFKNDFSRNAHIGVRNCLGIIRIARNNNMYGEDLSYLDLSRVPLNGCIFSAATNFNRSTLSRTTFLQQGHFKSVNDVVYNLNGQRMLSASSDKTIIEWDMLIGVCLQVFEGHDGEVLAVSYNEDESRILSLSSDAIIKEWCRETAKCINTFSIFNNVATKNLNISECNDNIDVFETVNSSNNTLYENTNSSVDGGKFFAINPDFLENGSRHGYCEIKYIAGHYLFVVLNSNIYKIDMQTTETQCIYVSSPFEYILAISRDWNEFVTSRYEFINGNLSGNHLMFEYTFCENMCVYNKKLSNLNNYSSGLIGIAYNHFDNKMLLTYSDGVIKEWDKKSVEFLRTFDSTRNFRAVYGLDDQRVLLFFEDGIIVECDKKTGEYINTFDNGQTPVKFMTYSPCNKRLMFALNDGTIKEWSTSAYLYNVFEKQAHLETRVLEENRIDRFFSVSKKDIFLEWCYETETCAMLHNEINVPKFSIKTLENADEFAYTIHQYMHLDDEASRLRSFVFHIWGSVPNENEENKFYTAFDNDRQRALTASSYMTIREWRTLMQLIKGQSGRDKDNSDLVNIVIDSARRQLCVEPKECAQDAFAILQRIKNIRHSKARDSIDVFLELSNTILSPVVCEDERIIFNEYTNEIREIDIATKQCTCIYKGHTNAVTNAIYSKDNMRVLSSSLDKTVIEWNRKNGEIINKLNGHLDGVDYVKYIENEKYIYSASRDGTFKKWHRETGACVWTTPINDGIFIFDCNFMNSKIHDDDLKRLIRVYGGRINESP